MSFENYNQLTVNCQRVVCFHHDFIQLKMFHILLLVGTSSKTIPENVHMSQLTHLYWLVEKKNLTWRNLPPVFSQNDDEPPDGWALRLKMLASKKIPDANKETQAAGLQLKTITKVTSQKTNEKQLWKQLLAFTTSFFVDKELLAVESACEKCEFFHRSDNCTSDHLPTSARLTKGKKVTLLSNLLVSRIPWS